MATGRKRVGVDFDFQTRQAVGNVNELERAVVDVEEAVDDSKLSAEQWARSMGANADDILREVQQLSAAAEALAQDLGPELAAKVDTAGIVAEMRAAGVAIDDMKANAGAVADELRRLDQTVGGLDQVAGATRRIGTEADQSRSVMANFTGNVASELPGVAGAFGPLNMAIGQFTEYATEGNIQLSSLVKLAAPMAGIAVAAWGAQQGLEAMSKVKAFERERVDAYVESLRRGEDQVKALVDRLVEAGEVKFTEDGLFGNAWFGRVSDARYAIANAGLSFDQFAEIALAGEESIDRWADSARAAGRDGDAVKFTVEAMRQELKAQGDAANEAAGMNQLNERSIKAVDDAMVAFIRNADPVKAMPDEFRRLADGLAGVEANGVATADATDALNTIMRETGLTMDEAFRLAADSADQATVSVDRVTSSTQRAQEDAKRLDDEWRRLQGTLSNESAFLSLLDQFDRVKNVGQDAWDAAVEGTHNADLSARDYRQEVIRLKDDVIRYAEQVGQIPPETVSRILTQIDDGNFRYAQDWLNQLNGQVATTYIDTIHTDHYRAARDANRARGGFVPPGERAVMNEPGAGPEEFAPMGGQTVVGPGVVRPARTGSSAPTVVNVTNNYPPGLIPRQVVDAGELHLHRNGPAVA